MIPFIPPGVLRRLEEDDRRRLREESVQYSAEELASGWEFKVLRSYVNAFHRPAYFHRVLAQEARAGWELVEALDAGRLRFKRPVARRTRDQELSAGCDPYRL